MPTDAPQNENTYFIDAESATEMARLMIQDRLLTKGMGGLFPDLPALSHVQDILDIGCGPGGWVLDVAHTYPEKQVVGIDISKMVIQYAQAQARVQWLDNATFRAMDALKPLSFPDNSFDLVNARFLFGFMLKPAWPKLMQECMRILRPGGILRLTECEAPLTSTPATEKLCRMPGLALKESGQGFSPDGRNIGITPIVGRFLQNAGFQNIQRTAHVLDCSAGTEANESFYQNFMAGLRLLLPFLSKVGVITEEEFEALYQQALGEIQSDNFCCVWYYLTVTGEKPQ